MMIFQIVFSVYVCGQGGGKESVQGLQGLLLPLAVSAANAADEDANDRMPSWPSSAISYLTLSRHGDIWLRIFATDEKAFAAFSVIRKLWQNGTLQSRTTILDGVNAQSSMACWLFDSLFQLLRRAFFDFRRGANGVVPCQKHHNPVGAPLPDCLVLRTRKTNPPDRR